MSNYAVFQFRVLKTDILKVSKHLDEKWIEYKIFDEQEYELDIIYKIVSKYTDVDIKTKTNLREVSEFRQIAFYIAKNNTKIPCNQIGYFFGSRNESTVNTHANKTIPNKMFDAKFKDLVLKIETECKMFLKNN
jgi:chromosomal replication initiation ATPase DnaA